MLMTLDGREALTVVTQLVADIGRTTQQSTRAVLAAIKVALEFAPQVTLLEPAVVNAEDAYD
jgi:hypothetical protein